MRVFIALALAFLCGPAVAQFNGCQTGFCTTVPVSISSTTTWNPSDKDPGITLSGGNLVATSSTTLANCTVSGYCAVRSIASHVTSGKFYYEVTTANQGAAPFDNCLGIANSAKNLGVNLRTGAADAASICDNGTVTIPGGGGTAASFVSGNVVSVAVDLGNSKIWFRVNNGNWDNVPGDDPATNTGGFTISTLNAGPYFAIVQGSNDANTGFTANFGGSSYAQSVPSGFGNW